MPSSSHLRIQTSFEPFTAEITRSHFVSSQPQKKQKMSLTQTYYIAASARSKLGKEACRADHDLRLLVGHANLLDSLMVELQDAERQQEQWFNQTMAKASKTEEPRHVQWADSIAEEPEEDDYYESDSESENEDDFDMIPLPRRIAHTPVQISTMEIDEEEDEDEFYDDMEDDSGLALTRVPSQSQSPPELVYEEESDDESPLASPPQSTLNFSDKEAMITTTFFDAKSQSEYMEDDHPLFMDTTAPLISSY
ncbi:hypothetical protein BDW02DRAFT_567229 [Decorospora gaudefroyi]|uniref:Uncharacterized protein n=1 Tax=Decorospora gaudefroyi TaxID=184978 RepID=A0A6A5KKL0_9PLEO|nr:hypothetical protein BDW02DRAFT_567229 [Decorospora gaudefroyi]